MSNINITTEVRHQIADPRRVLVLFRENGKSAGVLDLTADAWYAMEGRFKYDEKISPGSIVASPDNTMHDTGSDNTVPNTESPEARPGHSQDVSVPGPDSDTPHGVIT